jgi:low temperature requirement protein LtrA
MSGVAGTEGAVPKRASFLELFFDLVFVFAVTQIAATLHADHSARGWVEAGLLLWLVWWAWSQYTWAANAIDVDEPQTRVAMLVVTGVTLLAAVSIPDAFAADGGWFAVPYVAVRLLGLGLYWAGLRDQPEHRAALRTYLPVAVLSPLVVLVGGFVDADMRVWVWLVAVAVDVASVAAAGRGEFRVEPAHFAERHGLIVIIALGESIIAVGATAADVEPSVALVTAAAAAFAIVATLWWAYFSGFQATVEHALVREPDHRRRGHLARDVFTLGHLPIVAGTVMFAVGVEEAVLHPDEHLEPFGRWAVGLGLVLVQLGLAAAAYRSGRVVLVARVVAVGAVTLLVAVAGGVVSSLALTVALAVVLVALAGLEAARPRSPVAQASS